MVWDMGMEVEGQYLKQVCMMILQYIPVQLTKPKKIITTLILGQMANLTEEECQPHKDLKFVIETVHLQ
jgi:hypothetical protein